MSIIKVKYFDNEIEKLQFIGGKSDWIDLRCAERTIMKAGSFKYIPLGIGCILPDGFEAHLAPRSSTFKNYGIIQVNSVGVIDNSYSGNDDQWMMPVYATRDTVIEKGDRIAQFRIMKKMEDVQIVEVEHLNDNSRGGFGSTGKK